MMDTTGRYPGQPGTATNSPLRSLSSFKSEIGLTMEDPMSESGPKSFHQYLDLVINGIPMQSTILLLVCMDCVLVAVELLFSFSIIQNVSMEANAEMVYALSATSLAILSFFLLEVVTRIFTYGTVFRTHKLEIFDALVVFITFLLDLIFFVSDLETVIPGVRALTFLIALRLWRFYGIFRIEVHKLREDVACELQMEKYARKQAYCDITSQVEVHKLREDVACELQMEKYARRQADAQSDILRANCDQQLKEIAYLRDFIRQHSLDPSDSLKSDLITPVSSPVSTLTGMHYDKTDTLRANGRLSQEDTSIDESISTSVKEPASSVDNNEYNSSHPSSPQSTPAKSRSSTGNYDSLASREHTRHALTDVKIHLPEIDSDDKHGCYTNKGFEDVVSVNSLQDSVLGMDQESVASTAVRTDGTGSYCNPMYELDASVMRQDSGVGQETQLHRAVKRTESLEKDEDERLLRLELEEIRRLSEEALKSELAQNNTTTDENGIPTTSL